MESSPSRNPLLQNQHDDVSSEEESEDQINSQSDENNAYIATSNANNAKERHTSTITAPVDRFNFAFIVFYILGM
jgi:hypothetical protein